MAEKPSQRIVVHFMDTFKKKFTQKMFLIQLGAANNLLNIGFSEQDICSTISYLSKHPPVGGVSSLNYLQYCINDIAPKVRLEALRAEHEALKKIEGIIEVESIDTSSNVNKYESFVQTKIKGVGKF